MKFKATYLLAVICVMMFTQISEAQLFQRNTQTCAGSSVSRTGLFSRLAQRRTTRIQTASCSGAMATQSSGCAGGVPQYTAEIQSVVPQAQSVVPQATQDCPNGVCPLRTPVRAIKSFISSPELFGLSVSNDSLEIPKHILAQVAYEPTFDIGEIPSHILAQIDQPVKVADSFKPTLLKAIADGRKSGKLTVRDAVKLRVACLSPAFVERAHELAVTQIAMSGEESTAIPMGEDGVVQTEGINWEGLAKFLEAFIPLLITLLKAFGL